MREFSFDYDQVPPGYYDRIARQGTGLQRAWHVHKFEFLIDTLGHHFGQDPMHVLDLGCGPGTLLGMLRDRLTITGVGVDIASGQLEYAQRTYGSDALRFLAASFEAEEVQDEMSRADAITLVEVVEHLPLDYVYRTLSTIHARMKKGAMLVITTPNYLSIWPVLERAISVLGELNYEEQHILHFNRIKLVNLLATVGFDDIQVQSFMQFSPFVAGVLGSSVGRLARRIEQRTLRHAGPLLCARTVKI
ncbi:MAG: class I SAM-dependent methyltransferase [Pseudomonadota bacterium]